MQGSITTRNKYLDGTVLSYGGRRLLSRARSPHTLHYVQYVLRGPQRAHCVTMAPTAVTATLNIPHLHIPLVDATPTCLFKSQGPAREHRT